MRFRLRTLLIVLMLGPPLLAVGPLIFGKADYYQRRAAVHEEEAEKFASKLCPPEDRAGTNTLRYLKEYGRHRKIAEAYRNAAWKPWGFVSEPPTPMTPKNAKNNVVRGPIGGIFDALSGPNETIATSEKKP